MVREITIDENYSHVGVFNSMKKGDIVKVPFDKARYSAIRTEASRRNYIDRATGKLKNLLEASYRVSVRENPGYITIMKMK